MARKSIYALTAAMIIGVILLTVCSGGNDSPPATKLQVENAADARDVVISHLREQEPKDAPGSGISWREEDTTPPQWVGGTYRTFISGNWIIRVSYPVVALENTIYEVTVSGGEPGWYWKGRINACGEVTEVGAFSPMLEPENRETAGEFILRSPTFVFDGMEETLTLIDAVSLSRSQYCWGFIFEFDSRQAGYGDRTGQMLAQVITHHRVVITIDRLEVAAAVMDEKWDMLNQEMIEKQEEHLETICVGELLAERFYDKAFAVQGQVSLLGELLCPCFELTSCEETVTVWYGLMVESDGTERPAVSVEGIENGDTVIVTGELKGAGGTHYSEGDFWAGDIVFLY